VARREACGPAGPHRHLPRHAAAYSLTATRLIADREEPYRLEAGEAGEAGPKPNG